MIAVDTNVLIYAHREEFDEHERCLERLREMAESSIGFALPVFCIGEFLRVATHHRVFDPPSTRAQAWGFLDALLASPAVSVITPGRRFADHLQRAMDEADATGNLVFDAQIVAVLREHGVRSILSADRDLRRFDDLDVIDPRR